MGQSYRFHIRKHPKIFSQAVSRPRISLRQKTFGCLT